MTSILSQSFKAGDVIISLLLAKTIMETFGRVQWLMSLIIIVAE